MNEEKPIIEFITKEGVEIKLIKRKVKFLILVTESKKKIKDKKVFESLNVDKSTTQFFKICNYFTKDID